MKGLAGVVPVVERQLQKALVGWRWFVRRLLGRHECGYLDTCLYRQKVWWRRAWYFSSYGGWLMWGYAVVYFLRAAYPSGYWMLSAFCLSRILDSWLFYRLMRTHDLLYAERERLLAVVERVRCEFELEVTAYRESVDRMTDEAKRLAQGQ